METAAFSVILAGRVVGHLHQRGDYAWLEWQQGYWDDPNRPVLGLRFEDQPAQPVASALRLPPWFSNLLPEGRLRAWVAHDAGVNADREMMLLRRLGADLPGAVVVARANGEIQPRWEPDRFIAAPAPIAESHNRFRFSLAGVALKFSMLQDGERLTMPTHAQDGDWIVKMPDSTYADLPHNEFGIMTLARHVGIEVPEIRLVDRADVPELPPRAWPAGQDVAYAIKRFDRSPGGRVHVEDLAQVRGFYPDEKYKGSFATLAALVYRGHDLGSYLEFVRRLFFSYAVGNGDMHLKNLSLIYRDGRRPALSPAYDLVSTAPYREDEEDLGLKLGHSRRFADVTQTSFHLLARSVGAPIDQTLHTVADVAGRLEAAWEIARPCLENLPVHTAYLDERIPQIARRFG